MTALLLLAGIVAIYAPGLTGGFVGDDRTYFLENDLLPSMGLSALGRVFLQPTNYWGEHLPIRDALYLVEYHLFGLHPLGYHVVSLVLYCLVGWSLYGFVSRLYEERWGLGVGPLGSQTELLGPGFIVALFLLHPVHVESVAYVSGQKDLLFAFFTFFCLRWFLVLIEGGDNRRKLPWVIALFLGSYYLSFLSKLTAAATMLFVPFLGLIVKPQRGLRFLKWVSLWALINIPAVLWIMHGIRLYEAKWGRVIGAHELPSIDRILRAGKILGAHAMLAVRPVSLSFGYPFAYTRGLNTDIVAGGMVLCLFLVLLVTARRSMATVGTGLFVMYLTPALQLFQEVSNAIVYDRYLFVSVLGGAMIAERIVWKIVAHDGAWMARGGRTVAVGLLTVCALLSARHVPDFHSDERLTRHMYRLFPNWKSSAYNYAVALIESGKLDRAETLMEGEPSLVSPVWVGDYLRGWIRLEKGDAADAIPLLERSLQHTIREGYYPYPVVVLSRAYGAVGRYEAAMDVLGWVSRTSLYDPLVSYQAERQRKLLASFLGPGEREVPNHSPGRKEL